MCSSSSSHNFWQHLAMPSPCHKRRARRSREASLPGVKRHRCTPALSPKTAGLGAERHRCA
eukprot:5292438-Lingulodinium_polyedra.AAC.1